MYFIIAKYKSKYGVILYATNVDSKDSSVAVDMNNVYIHTLYFKSSSDIVVGQIYDLQTVKGENGLTYAFM